MCGLWSFCPVPKIVEGKVLFLTLHSPTVVTFSRISHSFYGKARFFDLTTPPPPSTLPILFSQRNGRTWNYANFALVQALHFNVDGMKWGHNLHHTLIVLWRYVIPCTIFLILPRLFCSSWVRFLSKKRYIKKTFYFWSMLNISVVKLGNPGVHPQLKGFMSP